MNSTRLGSRCVNSLQIEVPFSNLKEASPSQLRLLKTSTRLRILSLAKELDALLREYENEETDQDEAVKLFRLRDAVIDLAYEWIEEIEEVCSWRRGQVFALLDKIRRTVELFVPGVSMSFSGKPHHCVNYQRKGQGANVCCEELLSSSLQLYLAEFTARLYEMDTQLIDRFESMEEMSESG